MDTRLRGSDVVFYLCATLRPVRPGGDIVVVLCAARSARGGQGLARQHRNPINTVVASGDLLQIDSGDFPASTVHHEHGLAGRLAFHRQAHVTARGTGLRFTLAQQDPQ